MITKLNIRILFSVSVILLFAYCLRSLTEPDIWWQMRTGEWIWKHHQVPTTDFLSYTFNGEPWVNIKWLSEVIYYLIGYHIDPTAINVFGGLVFCAISAILFNRIFKDIQSYAFLYAFLLFGFILSYRMNGRPEMFSYLFTAFYLFIYYKSKDNIHWIWGLIPCQLLWVNMHEAYGVGLIMTAVFVFFNIFEKSQTNRIHYVILFLGVVGISSLNPRGTEIFIYSWNLYNQLNENSFTTEMVGWRDDLYWNIFTKLNVFVCVITSGYLINLWMSNKEAFKKCVTYYELVIYVLFFYLSLKSNRNLVFFQIISLPILVSVFDKILPNLFKSNFVFGIVISLVMYVFVVSGMYYRSVNNNNQFGLSVHPEKTPIGAYQFIKGKTEGKKVFSDFLSANYGLWELRPLFKSYIDLRDLDVFTKSFFENCYRLYEQPDIRLKSGMTLWSLADSIDHFDYVVLLNNESFVPLHQHLLQVESNFMLVYADPLASIYKRDSSRIKISKDWYHSYTFTSNKFDWLNILFNPFWINVNQRTYPYDEMKEMWKELIGIKE